MKQRQKKVMLVAGIQKAKRSFWRVKRAMIRRSPERIILGELQGDEAADLVKLLNTGHPGIVETGPIASGEGRW